MISKQELRSEARKRKVSLDLIEKDYVLGWALCAISCSGFASKISFKGGTALSKIYFPSNWRLSEDLDFTMLEDNNVEDIEKGQISELPLLMRELSGIESRIQGGVFSNETYLQFRLQYDGPISRNTLKIELSTEDFVGPVIRKEVPKVYDYANFSMLSYSIDNILSEKMRAILQRGKLRDYYDVWKLLKTIQFRPDSIREMFTKKCQTKGVEFRGIDQFFPQNLADNLKRYTKIGLTRLTSENLPDIDVLLKELRSNMVNFFD